MARTEEKYVEQNDRVPARTEIKTNTQSFHSRVNSLFLRSRNGNEDGIERLRSRINRASVEIQCDTKHHDKKFLSAIFSAIFYCVSVICYLTAFLVGSLYIVNTCSISDLNERQK